MSFAVPEGEEDLAERVVRQFRTLVNANVIGDVFSATELARWFGNFQGAEQRYLAARLLQSAIIRSWRMIDGSLRQIVDIVVPPHLRALGLHEVDCLDTFERELQRDRPQVPVRFMGVDGERIDTAAGNSGDAVLRRFGTQFQIGEGFRLRADRPASFTSEQPLLLVLLDDLLGTGTQISRFASRYSLQPAPANIHILYIPLLATREGVERAARDCPSITVHPIESLSDSARFFHPLAALPAKWSRDGTNSVADTREFYAQLMTERGIGSEGTFSLELTAMMPERCPNNTLRAYWERRPQWHPLKAR